MSANEDSYEPTGIRFLVLVAVLTAGALWLCAEALATGFVQGTAPALIMLDMVVYLAGLVCVITALLFGMAWLLPELPEDANKLQQFRHMLWNWL